MPPDWQRKLIGDTRQEKDLSPIPLGAPSLDAKIGGGMARGRLHEIFAHDAADRSSAAAFTALVADFANGRDAPSIWLREDAAQRQACLYAPGLVALGLDPGNMLLVLLPDPVSLLRAAVDVVRCASIDAVVIELWRQPPALDLTASRRLALAAEASGVTPLLLRLDAQPAPSAAQTRWHVSAAPSRAMEAEAPGPPAFHVELLRQRGRPEGGCWHLEWNRDRSCFDDAALSRPLFPSASRRTMGQG